MLGRTARSCEAIANRLASEGLQVTLVENKQEAYKGGLTVVPAYLAKGLEFDAVLIADADQASFGPNVCGAAGVACTRALHKLKLLYCGALTNLVQEAVVMS